MYEERCKGSCPPPRVRQKSDKWFELMVSMVLAIVASLICGGGFVFLKVSVAGSGYPTTVQDRLEAFRLWVWAAVAIFVIAFGIWAVRQVNIWWGEKHRGRWHFR